MSHEGELSSRHQGDCRGTAKEALNESIAPHLLPG
jgi:hypothetical protein